MARAYMFICSVYVEVFTTLFKWQHEHDTALAVAHNANEQLGILSLIGGIPRFGRFYRICSENTP